MGKLIKAQGQEVTRVEHNHAKALVPYVLLPMLGVDVVWNWFGIHTIAGMGTISLWQTFLLVVVGNVGWRFSRLFKRA